MFARWRATVFSLITSASATCLLVPPYVTCRRISASRSVRPPGGSAPGRSLSSRRRSTTASSPVSVRSATSSSRVAAPWSPSAEYACANSIRDRAQAYGASSSCQRRDGLAKTVDRLAGIPSGDQHRPTRVGRHGVQAL